MPFLYFDPGLGALLAQAGVAIAAAVALFWRTIKHAVLSMFGMYKNTDDYGDIDDADEVEESPSGNE